MANTLVHSFLKGAKKTISCMVKKNLDVMEIPKTNGMVAVRVGTEEEAKRSAPGVQLMSFEKSGQRFVVCAK